MVAVLEKELHHPMEHVAEITNRFRELIGKGGYSEVYRDNMGNKQVAVKRYITHGDQTKIKHYEVLILIFHHRIIVLNMGFCSI